MSEKQATLHGAVVFALVLLVLVGVCACRLAYGGSTDVCKDWGSGQIHGQNCNGDTLDSKFPLLRSKIFTTNDDPFNLQYKYKIAAQACYSPCEVLWSAGPIFGAIAVAICKKKTHGTNCMGWSGYDDHTFGQGDISAEIYSGNTACSLKHINYNVNGCVQIVDPNKSVPGGFNKYYNYDVARDIGAIKYVCGFATRSGLFSFTADKSDFIGCVSRIELPGPPILNGVIMPSDAPYVDGWDEKLGTLWFKVHGSFFDKPSIRLIKVPNSPGLDLIYDMRGSGAFVCGSFSGGRKYCGGLPNDKPDQICAYSGSYNASDVSNLLGCVPRPSIIDNSSLVVIPYYQSFIARDGSRYQGVIPLFISGLQQFDSPIGKDADKDVIGVMIGNTVSDDAIRYYGVYKAIPGSDSRKAANCDLLANADQVRVKEVGLIGSGKAACTLESGIKVEIPEWIMQDSYSLPDSCKSDNPDVADAINAICPKQDKITSLPIREYFNFGNVYMRSTAQLTIGGLTQQKITVMVEATIPKLFKPDGISGLSKLAGLKFALPRADDKNCNDYAEKEDKNEVMPMPFLVLGGDRDRSHCYCDDVTNLKTGECAAGERTKATCTCILCKKNSSSSKEIEEAVCPGSYPKHEDDSSGPIPDPKYEPIPTKICLSSKSGEWDFISNKNNSTAAISDKASAKVPDMVCADLQQINCVADEINIVPNTGNAIWPITTDFGKVGYGICNEGGIENVDYIYRRTSYSLENLEGYEQEKLKAEAALKELWSKNDIKGKGYIDINDVANLQNYKEQLQKFIDSGKVVCNVDLTLDETSQPGKTPQPKGTCVGGVYAKVSHPCIKVPKKGPKDKKFPQIQCTPKIENQVPSVRK